jgi:hypothetical protein
MKQLSNNEIHTFRFTGNLASIETVLLVESNAVNTTLVAADINLKEINITIKEKGGVTVFNGKYKELVLALASNSWIATEILNEVGTIHEIKDTAVAEKATVAMPLDLHLTGSFEITFRLGVVFASAVNSSSKVCIAMNMTTRVAEFTPIITLHDVPASTSSFQRSGLMGVDFISLVDLSTPTPYTAAYPWSRITVSSNLETLEYTIPQLKAISKAHSENSEVENGANLIVHDGEVMNNVTINMDLVAANVDAGGQFVCIIQNVYDLEKVKAFAQDSQIKNIATKRTLRVS